MKDHILSLQSQETCKESLEWITMFLTDSGCRTGKQEVARGPPRVRRVFEIPGREGNSDESIYKLNPGGLVK